MMKTIQSNGVSVTGYEALPAGGAGAGIIVLHAWWGLNDVLKALCDRLAAAGFVVFAPDLYHGAVAATIPDADMLSSKLDADLASQKIAAVVDYLQHQAAVTSPALGVIGFSLGAFFALRLAQRQPDDIAAVVLFYGTGDGQHDQTRAAVLGHYADNDPFEAAEYVHQLETTLRAAGCAVTFYTYSDTGHWFFESDRPDAYHADAARLAWERTLAFLRQHLA